MFSLDKEQKVTDLQHISTKTVGSMVSMTFRGAKHLLVILGKLSLMNVNLRQLVYKASLRISNPTKPQESGHSAGSVNA